MATPVTASMASGKAPAHQTAGTHGEPLRGLMSAATSPLFQGRFGRLFRNLPHASFGTNQEESRDNLLKLGKAMTADPDAPKDGPDDEESGIPALYTYFGQFIDHDITFDPNSSLQRQNDPEALIDYRTPAFDLDNVYGRGPNDQPYMYTTAPAGVTSTASIFLLGSSITGGTDSGAKDLPRNGADPARALIGDPRNDENAIVSQFQGLMLRFHNQIATTHPKLGFDAVQRLVRFHYQYVVLNDFLPHIVNAKVLDGLKKNGRYDRDMLKFFHWKNEPFMPVEFSVAAYRLGHSMVRPGYRLNNDFLLPIFSSSGPDLRGFKAMMSNGAIDWGRFIDVGHPRTYTGTPADNKQRLQFAYKIDTSLVNPLGALPASVVSDPPPSLAQRNLIRGWRLGLPSGQHVALGMGVKPLEDEQILIGKAIADGQQGSKHRKQPPSPAKASEPDPQVPPKSILEFGDAFRNNCPLWTYILAEAMQDENQEEVGIPVQPTMRIKTPKLGPVGGRIVAEVFLGLMFGDPYSMLSLEPDWHPELGCDYRLKNFVEFALQEG